jgi:hypothetical protein
MKKLLLLLAGITILGGIIFVNPLRAAAFDPLGNVCAGHTDTTVCSTDNKTVSGEGILATAIKILSIVAGIAAVFMIIVSAVQFITSGGDASKVSTARNALLAAVIGLIIVLMSQAILHFVIGRATAPASDSPACTNNGTKAPSC